MKDYFYLTNFSPMHLIEKIYLEMIDYNGYYLSSVKVLRKDVSKELRLELEKIINLPIADCGFLKSKPGTNYPCHSDVFRVTAINMPMFTYNEKFLSYIFDGKKFLSIEYKKDFFTILNVMQLHGTFNKSTDQERNILSIGIKDVNYSDVLNKHIQGKLFNVTL